MRRQWGILLSVLALVLVSSSVAWGLFGLGRHGSGTVAAFTETFHGLQHDMRLTLQAIRQGEAVKERVELLHDQLHLMREILHLVKTEAREEGHFKTLHDLRKE